jgi:hypothetical protein
VYLSDEAINVRKEGGLIQCENCLQVLGHKKIMQSANEQDKLYLYNPIMKHNVIFELEERNLSCSFVQLVAHHIRQISNAHAAYRFVIFNEDKRSLIKLWLLDTTTSLHRYQEKFRGLRALKILFDVDVPADEWLLDDSVEKLSFSSDLFESILSSLKSFSHGVEIKGMQSSYLLLETT